jgi:Protein of unknown function (DUF1353)
MPFMGQVVVSPIEPLGKTWTVKQAFTYTGKTDTFTVPAGFTTDFASVPRIFTWLLPRYGRWTQAAILHDFLWSEARHGRIHKFDADGIFNRAMRELGVPYLRRWIMWTAVRWAAGPKTWLYRGPVPVLKMIIVTLMALPVILVPSLTVLVGLILGATAEFIAYLPLRFIHRDKSKDVNAPEVSDIFFSG